MREKKAEKIYVRPKEGLALLPSHKSPNSTQWAPSTVSAVKLCHNSQVIRFFSAFSKLNQTLWPQSQPLILWQKANLTVDSLADSQPDRWFFGTKPT
jgi:hypothetical protein